MEHYKSMEDMFDKQILDSIEHKPEILTKKYDTIPKVFTDIKHWPRKTNLKCWMCDFFFEDVPKFIPTYIKDNNTNHNYGGQSGIELGVLGNMCSFSCTALYITTYFHKKDDAWKLLDNLAILHKLFTGKSVHYIPQAPHKTCMEQYGGTVSETDFRKKIHDTETLLLDKLCMEPLKPTTS
jgi:hypothetical protein